MTTSKKSTPPDEVELDNPDWITIIKLVWFTIRDFLCEKPGQLITSAIVLLMLWGFHGNLELLQKLWPAYKGPGRDIGHRPQLIAGIPWDHEIISFWGGAFLLVLIPILIIRLGFRDKLADYGLGWPPKKRRSLAFMGFVFLMAISLPAFALATKDPGMQSLYPFYRPFTSTGQFGLYQLCYLPFFIAIEFIFRGYLLIGLAGNSSRPYGDREEKETYPWFGRYAIVISMLSYTAWHLGKPMPELFGTLFWGFAAGGIVLATRSIWPVVMAHWLLNILLDGINAGIIHLF